MWLIWEQIKFSAAIGLQNWRASWREASRTRDLTDMFDRATLHHLLHSTNIGTWFQWPAAFKTLLHNGKSLRNETTVYSAHMFLQDGILRLSLPNVGTQLQDQMPTPKRTRFESPPSLSNSNYILQVHSKP